MAFKGNDSSKEVVREFKLYTGIQKMKPVLINPSLKELNDNGINFTTEPKYIQEPDEEGNKRVIIDIYVKVDKVFGIIPLRFYLIDKKDYSEAKNTYRFIDKFGHHGWDTMEGKCAKWKWIDETSVRIALKGEGNLHDWLTNYLAVNDKDECRLENPEKLFNEDYSELKNLLKLYPDNKFKGMLYVSHADNGKNYQKIYSSYFARENSTSTTHWEKHINKQIAAGYPIKGTYSYTFQEYKAVEPTSDGNNTSETSINSDVDNDLF